MPIWSLKNRNVLIVDDFQEMRAMLRSMIEPLVPQMLKLAQNAEEALELLASNKFDVVLCDYNLGKGKDGQQILEEAKHRGLLAYDAIYIMCTAENTSEMVMGAIEYKPDDYISKPFNRTVIHARLKKQLEKKENLKPIALAMSERNYKRALSLCKELLANQPPNRMELIKLKCELLTTLGEYTEAADQYEDIIEERDIPWAYLGLGKIRYLQKNYDEALEIFQGIVKDNNANTNAYDWLAKTYEAEGDLKKAQKMLTIGISKSPKSLLRQRKLAQVAYQNNDLETAETAYENAIEVGQYSCYKHADDYSALAKTLLKSDKPDSALKIIERIDNDFKDNPMATTVSCMTESMVYAHTGNSEAATKALDRALNQYALDEQSLSPELTLQLTELCLQNGREELADDITQALISNRHDDTILIEKTKNIYANAGKADAGSQLIDKTTSEIIKINNDGAKLLKEGKLEESIELFMKAARGMPNNIVVNTNAAYSMMMQMKKTGKVKKYSSRVEGYLERVYQLDPSNKKYYDLKEMLQHLQMNHKAA